MTKHTPWLEHIGEGWRYKSRVWLCSKGVDNYWHVKQFDFIRVVGTTTGTPGAIAARPYPVCGWCHTHENVCRTDVYADWLESFNAPVVYVWIEGTRWVDA